jgi:hypothetical protein
MILLYYQTTEQHVLDTNTGKRRHDIQHNDTQHNDTQNNGAS